MYNDINNKAIPMKVIKDSDLKKTDSVKPLYNEINFIGSYGTPNTYTADLPESIRKDRTKLDSTQRVAYVNPNRSYV